MEEQHECMFRNVYNEFVFNEEDTAKIAEGQYPLILAKDGVYTKLYVNETELNNYGIFNAKDEEVQAQHELHGQNIPVVWVRGEDGHMTETGIEPKIEEQPAE